MRRWMFLTLVLLMCCGDDAHEADPSDSGTPPTPVADGGSDAQSPPDGATPDGGAVTSCVDRPTDLPRPPTGRLPCELVPPGLTL